MKTVQLIRLIDVFFVGPFLIYIGSKEGINERDKFLLTGIGISTILYNTYHFVEEYSENKVT